MKAKNMFVFTVSYIPWICYWCASTVQIENGAVVSFFLELAILLWEWKAGRFSIFDVFSFLYWIVAIIFTQFMHTDIFLKGDGYLGYGALAVMALATILCKKPFMKYYQNMDFVKEQLDPVKEQKLAMVHSIVWMIVFALSSVIFWFIKSPVFGISLSNSLVAAAIIISIYENSTYFVKKK